MATLDTEAIDLREFLANYPSMSVRPNSQPGLNLTGELHFTADPPPGTKADRITDSYQLRIQLPPEFPKAVPQVWEIGGKIPPRAHFHINQNATICLGTPLELLLRITEAPTILGFIDRCVIPYLYAASHKLHTGEDFIFGEYAHGSPGIIDSYVRLFELTSAEQVQTALKYLTMKKRVANKLPCACECGLRQGRCAFNAKLNRIRSLVPRNLVRQYI